MNIKFKHFRYYNNEHLLPHGGQTVAYVDQTPLFPRDVPHTFRVAYAICSDKDNFNKKIGRLVSSGRLKDNVGVAEFQCIPATLYEELFAF